MSVWSGSDQCLVLGLVWVCPGSGLGLVCVWFWSGLGFDWLGLRLTYIRSESGLGLVYPLHWAGTGLTKVTSHQP